LLTGKPPFDSKSLLKAGIDQMRRIIREQEPPRPSASLSTLAEGDLTTIASHHGAQPLRLINSIRGDLDWIVMKCLEKDRTRRFETVNGLATDIKRHLGNEPVTARPSSQFYRLQKTIQKNKVLFSAAGTVALALLIGFGVSSWMFVNEKKAHQRAATAEREQRRLHGQAEAERARAEQERETAQQQADNARREKERADG
jgi:hypothetical protein